MDGVIEKSGSSSVDPIDDGLPFRQVAEALATPCWISDPEGQIVWVNKAWIAYTGAGVDEVRARGLKSLHDPDVYPAVLARWQEVKARGDAAEMVFPLRGKDGRLRPFHTRVTPIRDSVGNIIHWFGINTDISAPTQTEARLRSSEEQLREVFDRAGDGVFITDVEGLIVDLNPAACGLGQYAREELIGRPVWDLIAVDEQADLTLAREQDQSVRDWKVRRKDGSLVEVEISSCRLSDGRRLGVARDVSARRRADEQERSALVERADEAERHLGHFWDASRDLFAIVSETDGVARFINERAWLECVGYSAQEIASKPLMDFVHPDDRERTLARHQVHIAEKAYFDLENRYIRRDGGIVWLSWNVTRDNGLIYCSGRDVTQEKRTQERLVRSDREFRLLVAGVVDYALFMLTPEGIVATWNAGAERIKGYTAAEIVGRHISVFYTDADRELGKPAVALATAAAQGRYEAEAWRVRKDGRLFWANVVIDAIHDETGKLVGFAKITRDITERRNAQIDLQRTNERLAQAQKMEALGQLTGGVAHDFNNLLMVMGGQAELLRGRIGNDARTLRSLEAIVSAAKRGQGLTRHLLSFARRQRLNPAPISLSRRAAEIQELVRPSLDGKVALHVDFPPDLWAVEIDANEFELAILNMAVNARDAMPRGGRLTISAANATTAPQEDGSELEGEFVKIIVADTGVGIPADILPKVMEPFFTTKAVNKGTGLGLSQVYGFVQQSGGRMTIDSELGQGASISLYLPRSLAARPASAEPPTAPVATGLDILCIEDNLEVADVAAGMLAELGNRVRPVNSAQQAIQSLETGARPDMIFSDIVMAGDMDGLGLARYVRQRWPELPILLTTGYSRAAQEIGGEFPVLTKPYQLAELKGALAAANQRIAAPRA
jgi:PAS domain S-box-containing protein